VRQLFATHILGDPSRGFGALWWGLTVAILLIGKVLLLTEGVFGAALLTPFVIFGSVQFARRARVGHW